MLTVRINGKDVEGWRKYAYVVSLGMSAIICVAAIAFTMVAIAFLLLNPFIASCAVWPK